MKSDLVPMPYRSPLVAPRASTFITSISASPSTSERTEKSFPFPTEVSEIRQVPVP